MSSFGRTLLSVLTVGAFGVTPSFGAVALTLGGGNATPVTGFTNAQLQFPVSVILTTTLPTEVITGVDYRLSASTANLFKIVSRTTVTTLNGISDAEVASANIVLQTNTGTTDLGGDRAGFSNLGGSTAPTTVTIANFVLQALSAPPTPTTYIIGFVPYSNTGGTAYSADDANFTRTPFTALGSFAVTVPEPGIGLVTAGIACTVVRRRRSVTL